MVLAIQDLAMGVTDSQHKLLSALSDRPIAFFGIEFPVSVGGLLISGDQDDVANLRSD